MCALLLPGNISPLRSQIVLPSVLSVSSVLILLKKSSQQTIKTLDLTLHHSSSPLDSWYPFSQIWYYELETVLVSSCEIKNTLFETSKKCLIFIFLKLPISFWCWQYVWKLLKMSHLNFSMLAFSTNFCLIKSDLSGNTVWPLRLQCRMRLFLWFSNTV